MSRIVCFYFFQLRHLQRPNVNAAQKTWLRTAAKMSSLAPTACWPATATSTTTATKPTPSATASSWSQLPSLQSSNWKVFSLVSHDNKTNCFSKATETLLIMSLWPFMHTRGIGGGKVVIVQDPLRKII